ncbi:MAG: hypothetical protein R2824_29420 [Saprospiraceae bacterium]|nr:hypothetical protein [Lewinella sp.]
MKIFPFLTLLLVLSVSAQAQFGFNGKYLFAGDNWQLTPSTGGQEETSDLFDKGWSAGVDYWFRLRNKRIEFLPELNYTQLNNSLAAYANNEAKIYSFFFNTNIYFLDLPGDCDCPTWSKEGPTLKKGLFLQLSPGISYWDMTLGAATEDVNLFADRHLAFSMGAGLGFDLGLSDLITFTPMVNVRYFQKITLDHFDTINAQAGEFVSNAEASPLFLSAGVRLGIRLDH